MDRRAAPRRPPRADRPEPGVVVLDVVFLAAIGALFALVVLVAKGVERLDSPPSATRESAGRNRP
ncbi:MAG: hypothetical protein FJW64_03320 [Actinobacteria bacterium]|nr:hypothetical protein [Actinomycetota bacterium]